MTPQTKEIIAIYEKEESKLEIKVQIPKEYPVKLIEIEYQRGVKLDEVKIKKFILMMRSLLA